jgi:acetoin utilization deacetylase AcuC-like enzyme
MYKIAFHPKYVHPVPEGHRFPMEKYDLLPLQLMCNGIVDTSQFFEPRAVAIDHLYQVHDKDYVNRFINLQLTYHEGRRIGFLQDEAIVERELLLVQGTIEGALHALEDGVAFNIAGGTHHACYAHGEGFCMLHDQAVAAQYLINHKLSKRILIIDLDVHQGNGTADLFYGREDVFTFSMHCQDNYPFHKKTSHLDIGLPLGMEDAAYLQQLKDALDWIKHHVAFDFIFYQAGVDILHTDKMGKLKCTHEGCAERDRLVFEFALENKTPIQCSMGGGYSKSIKDILDAHTNTYMQANLLFT